MRIVHTADNHLGYRQYGFSERLEDFMLATAYVFHQAQALGADHMILAGDQFQTNYPSGTAVYFFYTQVLQAEAAGVHVLGIDGNHDATDNMWLRVCGINPLDEGSGDGVFNIYQSPDGVRIAGLNGATAGIFRERLTGLVEDQVALGQKVDVLVLHQSLAEMCGFQGVDLTCSEIAAAVKPMGTRLVLMGDIHDYSESVIGDVRFIYAGSTELNERDERPDKSFSVIDITPDTLQTSMYPIPIRPVFDVYIENEPQLDQLLADLDKCKSADGRLPLALVSYDPEIPNFQARAKSLLQGRVIYQLISMPKTQQDINIFAQLGQQTFERRGALLNLREIIAAAYPDSSDEFQLILRLLDQPDDARGVIAHYVKEHKLENLVKL